VGIAATDGTTLADIDIDEAMDKLEDRTDHQQRWYCIGLPFTVLFR